MVSRRASTGTDGGVFDVTEFDFGRIDRHGCAWGHLGRDGKPDLYCTQGADKGRGSGPNQLFAQ